MAKSPSQKLRLYSSKHSAWSGTLNLFVDRRHGARIYRHQRRGPRRTSREIEPLVTLGERCRIYERTALHLYLPGCQVCRKRCADCRANIGQIVSGWMLTQPGITFSLCGARNGDQTIENAGAGAVRLLRADLMAGDAAIAAHLGPVAHAIWWARSPIAYPEKG